MNKDIQIRFRIDQDTRKFIEGEEKNYKSRSEFIRAQLEGISPLGKQKTILLELEKMRMEIRKIGINVNQITKNNNSELYSDKDRENLDTSLKKIMDLEMQLMKKLEEL